MTDAKKFTIKEDVSRFLVMLAEANSFGCHFSGEDEAIKSITVTPHLFDLLQRGSHSGVFFYDKNNEYFCKYAGIKITTEG